jgi:N utilization substance protein A
VGLKGVRIQAVIRELEGEKIDVIPYDIDPRRFIKNALSPAEVRDVIITDESKHQALAVVAESQLSLAIGKQGLNVRLANRLCDWNIDVKTDAQFAEMDISSESRSAWGRLFGEEDEEISKISELPGVDAGVAAALLASEIDFIEDFLALSPEEQAAVEGVAAEQLEDLRKLIDEYIEVVEEPGEEAADDESAAFAEAEDDEEAGEEEVFECPECGAKITPDMTTCPNCGIGLSFEYEE